jgi:pantoate kinase
VDLKIRVPIGAGFGTSAAGTLAACLALADAADIPTTLNDLGRLTHVADVLNSTGLGTASALVHGGFVLVTEPGAPGIGMVDQLLFPSDYVVVCAYLGSIPKREALSEMNLAPRVNPAGGAVLEAVRKRPNLQTFLRECRTFDSTIGFETPGVSQLIETMVSAGAVGAVQNMLGEAVHGVIAKTRAERAVKKIQAAFPTAKVFASELDNLGVRLV